MNVAGDLETFADDRRVELDLRKDCGIRMEVHRGAGAARGSEPFQRTLGLAVTEAHFPERAVPLDGGDELFRQRVHDAGADAVQTTGRLVVALLEFPAGM